jgi:hypothetical protein
MGSDNSTGNFIVHLATHRITEESHKRKMSEIRNNSRLSQDPEKYIYRSDESLLNHIIKFQKSHKFVFA